MADINDATGTGASGTNYSGLTSANYGITSPYVMQMLGRGQAIANTGYTPFKLPGGEGQADSARVANLNPMESNAYSAIGGMNFQDPMNQGMGSVRNATNSQWGAGTASPYMNAYNASVGGGNPMYNQAMAGLGGLNFQNAMARGMGGTDAAMGSSFNTAGGDYLSNYKNAVGSSSMMDQAGRSISGINPGANFQQGMNYMNQAANSQFNPQQANQYMNTVRGAVGSSAMTNQANRELSGFNSANAINTGMNLVNQVGSSTFGGQGVDQYKAAQGTSEGLNAATNAFGQAGGAQGMQQGMQGLADLAKSSFGEKEAQQYMTPYMQNVMEQQKQNAMQDYARQLPGQSAAAFQAGAGRGTRSALLQAEGQRNLQNQLQDITAKGTQAAYENAQKQYGEDMARRMQAAQSQVSSGTDITGRQASLGENELARNVAGYTNAQNQYNTEQANKLAAANAAFGQGTDILGRKTSAGDTEFNRNMQMYQQGNQQYNTDIANKMQAGQNIFNMGSDIYGKQYQYGADELARNRDAYTAAQNQYNTEMANRLNASNQLFNQGNTIYGNQYQAGATERQQQIDAYNRSMDQYNADMNRQMMGGQNLFNMGSDIYGKQIAGGEAQRNQKQRELDAMYEDFQKEINQPKENVNYMMQLLGQVPQYQDYSTKSYQTAAPVDPNAAYANALGALGTYFGGGANGGSSASGWGGALEGIANALGGGNLVDKFKSIFGGK